VTPAERESARVGAVVNGDLHVQADDDVVESVTVDVARRRERRDFAGDAHDEGKRLRTQRGSQVDLQEAILGVVDGQVAVAVRVHVAGIGDEEPHSPLVVAARERPARRCGEARRRTPEHLYEGHVDPVISEEGRTRGEVVEAIAIQIDHRDGPEEVVRRGNRAVWVDDGRGRGPKSASRSVKDLDGAPDEVAQGRRVRRVAIRARTEKIVSMKGYYQVGVAVAVHVSVAGHFADRVSGYPRAGLDPVPARRR
jgi:hypothetical protein